MAVIIKGYDGCHFMCEKICYIFVTTILTLHVVCDKMIHMYESF